MAILFSCQPYIESAIALSDRILNQKLLEGSRGTKFSHKLATSCQINSFNHIKKNTQTVLTPIISGIPKAQSYLIMNIGQVLCLAVFVRAFLMAMFQFVDCRLAL